MSSSYLLFWNSSHFFQVYSLPWDKVLKEAAVRLAHMGQSQRIDDVLRLAREHLTPAQLDDILVTCIGIYLNELNDQKQAELFVGLLQERLRGLKMDFCQFSYKKKRYILDSIA